ncbi:MAG: STAS domain-containing protein [Planctomycetota bacterium]|nr:STAS domain-containing protein [Planctomycetota bacterium]
MSDRPTIAVSLSRHATGAVVVSAKGDIAYHEAPEYRTYLRQAFDQRPTRVVADLSGVPYMATPGLATLVEALQISKKSGTPLVLSGLTERVRAIFEIARLHTVFRIASDVDAALQG